MIISSRSHGSFAQTPAGAGVRRKFPPANPLARRPRCVMLAARQQRRLPPERTLLIDDAERAKHIAALQRQRMVENVQNSHHSHRLLLMITPHDRGSSGGRVSFMAPDILLKWFCA